MEPSAATSPAAELLVVDDNPATRYSTSRVLKAAGFTVREAATGADALSLADGSVAGVVLDVHLPDINGFEVCRILRERVATTRLPIVHLSAAYVANTDKVRGLQSGADAYMTHPAEPTLLVATLQALIRARTAEEGMRRSEARFKAIYNQAVSGIGLFDMQGRFIDANPAMLTLVKRRLDSLVGRSITEFMPLDAHDSLSAILEKSFLGVWRGEFPLMTADNRWVHLEWSWSAHAEPGVVLAIATDISERLTLAAQREELLEREQAARGVAERLNRSKDEFIAVLSHELRTPLNSILSWVHVLKRLDSGGNMARGLESIERNAQIQTRLVSDILDVSRMDLGKLRLHVEPVEVPDLVRSAVTALAASIGDKELDVRLELDQVTRPVNADAARLQQIVWNLLTNAIKFSSVKGRIRIFGAQDEAALTLSVADEGLGIKSEFLPLLFDRFTQADSGSNRYHGGLGLGLSIVKHLVQLHEGSVVAHSDGLGQGATFTVKVPLHLTPDRLIADSVFDSLSESDGSESALPLEGITALVVDDDQEAREMLMMILGERGARVLTAGSCDEALSQMARGVRADVLISDVGMPGRDGYELVRAVRHREQANAKARLPAIALTAFARVQDKQVAFAAGFDAHCGKPLRPNDLIAAIKQLTAK